ncbi:TOMM precursor leader peptide-binding protein [Streptomyces sp. NPDC007205]|uniref:TOMM precursor leader peptide-binding protein n=1 Tax=Streptomyces sp. NPDC007205 TaxID=3154316 RepID=UPI003404050A
MSTPATPPVIPFAGARVRIKRDVLFTETDNGVLFHNAHGGFQLAGRSAYRFASLIVPYLNGDYTVRELSEMLPPQQQQMVSSLVRMLMERGLARDVPATGESGAGPEPAVAERFEAQINYIDHFEDRASARFHAFRTARVVVLGDDAVAGWCAVAALRNGIASIGFAGPADVFAQAAKEAAELAETGTPASVTQVAEYDRLLDWSELDGFDLVVCTGRQAPAQVVRLLTQGVPEGSRLLPLTRYGHRVVVGPLARGGGDGACWSCAMLRLGFNGDSGAAADVWRAVALGGGQEGREPGRHLSAILGNLLGYEVFREFTGVLPPETENSVIVQEIDSFDTAVAQVLRHPQCTLCADRGTAPAAPDWRRVRLTAPVVSSVRGATDEGTDPAVAELDELTAQLVGAAAGVFREFDDEWPTQLPLKVSRLRFGTGTGSRRVVTAFDLHHVAGARMRALRRAAADYLDLVTLPYRVPAADGQGVPRIEPAALTTFTGVVQDGPAADAWCAAASLADGTEVLVPAGAVRPCAPALNPAGAFEATPAGLGVGVSAGEAAHEALFSALAHHALRTAVSSGAPLSPVTPESLAGDDELTFLLRSAENLGVAVELLRLDSGTPAAVLLARARQGDGTPRWATGADLVPARAARTALRDLLGQFQILGERPEEEAALGRSIVASLDPYTLATGDTVALGTNAAADTGAVLGALRERGLEPYAVGDGSPDLRQAGLHAVRVLFAATGRS